MQEWSCYMAVPSSQSSQFRRLPNMYSYPFQYWLVLWNMFCFLCIGNFIIPTVTHSIIFQRGGEKPPTRIGFSMIFHEIKPANELGGCLMYGYTIQQAEQNTVSQNDFGVYKVGLSFTISWLVAWSWIVGFLFRRYWDRIACWVHPPVTTIDI